MVLDVYAGWGIELVCLSVKLNEACVVLFGAGDAIVAETRVGSVDGLVIISVEMSWDDCFRVVDLCAAEAGSVSWLEWVE